MVKINGKEYAVEGMTLLEYLKTTVYDPTVIAVERNEEIIPKARYGETILKENDIVEIVSFVGGG